MENLLIPAPCRQVTLLPSKVALALEYPCTQAAIFSAAVPLLS